MLREAGEGNDRETTLRLAKGASEVWIALRALGGVDKIYWLVIVEKQAMQQDVTVDANAMARDIGETGRVALYGIHFDTGKSELKPDSTPALVEIAKMLKAKPELKVYVVGHTDMVADLATNVALSQARAQAVVKALVGQQGIAAARLIAFGDGPMRRWRPTRPRMAAPGTAESNWWKSPPGERAPSGPGLRRRPLFLSKWRIS